MKKCYFILVIIFMSLITFGQAQEVTVRGTVTFNSAPIEAVNIKVVGSASGTTSDHTGKYQTKAQPGDFLEFSYVGKQTVRIRVEDVTRILNIELLPEYDELDEVVVTKRKSITKKDLAKNYFADPTIINSGLLGYISSKAVGYQLRTIDGKDLNTSSWDILDAIAEELPGITVYTNPNGNIGRFLYWMSRGALRGVPPAAFEVDGTVFSSGNAPVWLNINDVLRVGVIPPNIALLKYGKIAEGGMVIINTIAVRHGLREEDNKPYDLAKLRNNRFEDSALNRNEVLNESSTYLSNLYKFTISSSAEEFYKKNEIKYQNSPYFFIDSYAFFKGIGNDKFSKEIANKAVKKIDRNPMLLKAWAYYYEANGDFEKANAIYEKVFILRPNYLQSYRDLAHSYREIKNFKKSAGMYARYQYLRDEKLFFIADSVDVNTIMEREFDNLLSLEGDQIFNETYTIKRAQKPIEFEGTRLVFEWNDSEAEFDLQFVNPQKQYHNWEHTRIGNIERVNDEKIKGYSMQEFLMDSSLPGKWQVNATYYGNKRLEPTYLKATVYHNYGLVSQRKEVKVFRFGLKNVNQKLFELYNPSKVSNQ